MAKKLTQEEHEEIASFVKDGQTKIGSMLILQMEDMDARENTVHTEVFYKHKSEGEDAEPRKFLITTTVQPLTQELKDRIMKKK